MLATEPCMHGVDELVLELPPAACDRVDENSGSI